MKQAWSDLKSFVTVSMVILLYVIVVSNVVFNITLADNILILVSNLITAVFTYYFTKKESTDTANTTETTVDETNNK